MKQPAKQTVITKPASSQQQQQNNNNKASKSKNKREEELVKKLFEQNTAKTDEFTQWCNKALSSIQASVDSKYFMSNILRKREKEREKRERERERERERGKRENENENFVLYAYAFAVPTFVGFLRDIESAYEVKEYVRVYLGDTKQSTEFAKQFLEKRSKWRSAQRPQAQADDLCKPAPAVNPNAPAEFQEVKV